MDSVSSVIDRLYTGYLLRDLVAKVLPGSLVIGALAFSPRTHGISMRWLAHLPWWSWVLAIALAFIVGFAIQAIGEWTGWARIYPDGSSRDETARRAAMDRMVALGSDGSTWATQQRERYVVLKEMAANVSLAAVITIVILVTTLVSPILGLVTRLVFLGSAIACFRWFNRVQASDQRYLEEQIARARQTARPARGRRRGA